MNIFIDTEFTCLPGDGSKSELISIGIYGEDGSSYYGCRSDFDRTNLSDFVTTQVLPLLPDESLRKSTEMLRQEILSFILDKTITHVWATFPTLEQLEKFYPNETDISKFFHNYADWDFKLLIKLLGTRPKNFPMHCDNISNLLATLEAKEIPENSRAHDALEDAIWNFKVWEIAGYKQYNV